MKVYDHWTSWPQARRDLERRLAPDTLATLDRAVAFATTCHGAQTRPAGEPYLVHLLEVLEILVEGAEVIDPEVLVAGVLHDVVEDTSCAAAEIEAQFGPGVATLVDWVTKPEPAGSETPATTRDLYLAHLQSAPRQAILVKLADRLSNVQKLNTHPRPEKQRSYYQETVTKVMPLAHGVPWFDHQFQLWRAHFRYLGD